MTRVLVTGSRDWVDMSTIYSALLTEWDASARDSMATLVHGDARGADRMARDVWAAWALPVEPFPALWRLHGTAAGPLRNSQMVARGADVCLAFPMPGSVGTWDCVRKARAAGIPVKVFSPKVARVG